MLNYQRVSKDKTPSWKCVQLVFTASTVSQLGASGKRSVYQKPSSCSTLQHQPLGKAVEREMVGQMALFCFWKINRPKVDSFSSCFRPSLLSRSAAEHPHLVWRCGCSGSPLVGCGFLPLPFVHAFYTSFEGVRPTSECLSTNLFVTHGEDHTWMSQSSVSALSGQFTTLHLQKDFPRVIKVLPRW